MFILKIICRPFFLVQIVKKYTFKNLLLITRTLQSRTISKPLQPKLLFWTLDPYSQERLAQFSACLG